MHYCYCVRIPCEHVRSLSHTDPRLTSAGRKDHDFRPKRIQPFVVVLTFSSIVRSSHRSIQARAKAHATVLCSSRAWGGWNWSHRGYWNNTIILDCFHVKIFKNELNSQPLRRLIMRTARGLVGEGQAFVRRIRSNKCVRFTCIARCQTHTNYSNFNHSYMLIETHIGNYYYTSCNGWFKTETHVVKVKFPRAD